jgi:osmoprotectant transport system substrate-binding protein
MLGRRAFVAGSVLLAAGCRSTRRDVVVGSKNFTEQVILGEIFAQMLEKSSGEEVTRRFYLAGTYLCQQAILAGRIDVYPEYTGTALAAVLHRNAAGDAAQVFEEVKRLYREKFNLDVMPPLGFNNSFAMVMRGDDARRMNLSRLSQLSPFASGMRLGVGYEFLERADGYRGLVQTYNLKFSDSPRVMDLGLLYRALQGGAVDLVAGSNTDGLIAALGLAVLDDDRHYFPPYLAVPIVRPELFQRSLSARVVFDRLAGSISADEMRKLNYAVDGEKRDPATVVRSFLLQKSLIA